MTLISQSKNSNLFISKTRTQVRNQNSENYNPSIDSNTVVNPHSQQSSSDKFYFSRWGDIKGDIQDQTDLIEYLIANNIGYLNPNVEVHTVKEMLDLIGDKLFYEYPVPVSGQFTATCYRNNEITTEFYKGMTLNRIIYRWSVYNYLDSKITVKLNDKVVTGSEYAFTLPLISDTTSKLQITSDYVDSKGNSPSPYNSSINIKFNDKIYCWDLENESNEIPLDKTQIFSKTFNYTTSSENYIYFMFPFKVSWIHIFEKGSQDPGGTVTQFVKEEQYQEYDYPIRYYIYRSIYAIKGDWTIKYQ